VLWTEQLGRGGALGGIEWVMAADDTTVYVPQAATAIPGAVFSGTLGGLLRAHSSDDGRMLWEFDTVRDFETVNGVKARGGTLNGAGPVIAGGMVLVGSGYGRFGQIPGNVLLCLSVDGR